MDSNRASSCATWKQEWLAFSTHIWTRVARSSIASNWAGSLHVTRHLKLQRPCHIFYIKSFLIIPCFSFFLPLPIRCTSGALSVKSSGVVPMCHSHRSIWTHSCLTQDRSTRTHSRNKLRIVTVCKWWPTCTHFFGLKIKNFAWASHISVQVGPTWCSGMIRWASGNGQLIEKEKSHVLIWNSNVGASKVFFFF